MLRTKARSERGKAAHSLEGAHGRIDARSKAARPGAAPAPHDHHAGDDGDVGEDEEHEDDRAAHAVARSLHAGEQALEERGRGGARHAESTLGAKRHG